MERLRIGVVDRSPSIRETVAIVLREHNVTRFTPEEFSALTVPFAGHLVLVERGAVSPETLTRVAPEVPVLWIQGEGEEVVDPWALPRLFQPQALRRRVREFCSGVRHLGRDLVLPSFAPPLLPAEAATTVRAALQARLPTLVHGEPGTGKLRLARALHQASGNKHFRHLNAATFERHLLDHFSEQAGSGGLTLCLSAIESHWVAAQAALTELFDLLTSVHPRLWLISLSTVSPEDLAATAEANATLFHRLAVFTVLLPPLRERVEELPGIIAAESARLSSLLHVSPASFTPEAWDLLKHYLWFGNLSELEAVLARSMTLVHHRPIGAEEIFFDPPDRPVTNARPPGGARSLESSAPSVPPGARQLEVLLNELAHELKNPLVTIKTISQHLERLLSDEAGREQVAQLAGEAVDRMDQLLDNLLRFARFGAPSPQQTSLNAVLAPALAELAPVISEKQVLLHYVPAEAQAIYGDPVQLSFAMENLFRAVLRDLDEGATLAIEPATVGTAIQIRFPRAHMGTVERLGSYVDSGPEPSGALEPLGFLIARSLLERNGARLEERNEGTVHHVLVTFVPAEKPTKGYGEETRFDRG